MLKWVFRLLTIASVAAAIGLPFYFEAGLNGTPGGSDTPTLSLTPQRDSGTITKVYKWRDSSGTWQYSDQAPESATDIQVIDINSDTNLLQSPQAAEAEAEGLPLNDPEFRRSTPVAPEVQNSVLPDMLGGSALRQAEEARRLLEERKSSIDEALEQ